MGRIDIAFSFLQTISWVELLAFNGGDLSRKKGSFYSSFPMNLVWLLYKKYNQNFTKKLKGLLMWIAIKCIVVSSECNRNSDKQQQKKQLSWWVAGDRFPNFGQTCGIKSAWEY